MVVPVYLAILLSVLIVVLITIIYFQKSKKPIQADFRFEKLRAANFPPPFPNGWFSLCSSKDVRKGQVIEVNAFGKKLAVFRGEDGQVGAVDVFCPHLGANLADGYVKGNRLVCPFHAWEFSKNGKCEHIPYSEGNCHTEKNHAKQWIVKENWGMILVWHHANSEVPSWHTDNYLQQLKDYKYYGSKKETLHIHLQDFSENGADYAHFGVVHNLLTIPILRKFLHVKHSTHIEFGQEHEKHLAWFTDIADIAVNKTNKIIKDAGGKALVTYYGPGFLVFDFKTRMGCPIILKSFTPVGELELVMEDHIYAPKGSFWPAIKYIVGEASLQFRDDIKIWERKTFQNKPALVKGDGPIMKMRKWYSQFYSEKDMHTQNEVGGRSHHSVTVPQEVAE